MTRVLIVDDEKSIRQTLAEFLKAASYDVYTAEDAEVAQVLLKQRAFDVVVTDIILPRMDGIQLLERVRALAPFAQVIMMTGEPTVNTAVEAVRAGAHDYLTKPVTKPMILHVVRRAAAVKVLLDEKRRLQEDNRRYQENLERLVEERTRALRESEALYHSLVEQLPQSVFRKDAAGRFTFANQRHCQMVGRSLEELLGKTDADFYPPELAQKYQADDRRVMETGEVFDAVESHRCPSGEEMFVHVVKTPLRDPAGRIIGVQGIYWDVTDRHRAEEARRRLSTAMEQAAEAIVITDAQGAIVYVNPAFEKNSGYTRQEATGQNPRFLKSGKHDAGFYKQLWGTLTRGEVWHGRFINKRKDGALYEEETTISPVRDTAGRIVNFIALKLDVTREVQLEAELRQAQKMEAVGRLAGGVAHDFNNLLTAILGYSDILLRKIPAGAPMRAEVEEIQLAGNRAASLTRQLLAFSRKQKLEPQVLDLNKVVGNLQKMLRRLIGEDIELAIEQGADLHPVLADPGQIEQVILNLTVNARDAMPDGGRLAIQTANATLSESDADRPADAKPGDYVMLAVGDTGCGMTEEVKAHIFEPFFTTKPQGKGTGLGLPTIYGIIKQSGGHITFQSEPGTGTTFRIYLPRVAKVKNGNGSLAAVGEAPGGSEVILIAEDDEGIRRLASLALQSGGYTVLVAASGLEALSLAKQHTGKLDLLLSDIIMPGIGGTLLAKTLQGSHPRMKTLFMSGYTHTTISPRELIETGAGFLQKPFTLDALARKVREVLDAPPKQQPKAVPAKPPENPT
jgi:PAS domain S-box-containing protein